MTESNEDLNQKYQRAEKIAAFIEKQLKSLTPNKKISYQLVANVEPSTQLIAALMVKDPPIVHDMLAEENTRALLTASSRSSGHQSL